MYFYLNILTHVSGNDCWGFTLLWHVFGFQGQLLKPRALRCSRCSTTHLYPPVRDDLWENDNILFLATWMHHKSLFWDLCIIIYIYNDINNVNHFYDKIIFTFLPQNCSKHLKRIYVPVPPPWHLRVRRSSWYPSIMFVVGRPLSVPVNSNINSSTPTLAASSSHLLPFSLLLQQSSGGAQPGLPAFYFPSEKSAIQNLVSGDCAEHKRLPAGQEWKHTPGGLSGQGLYRRRYQLAGWFWYEAHEQSWRMEVSDRRVSWRWFIWGRGVGGVEL